MVYWYDRFAGKKVSTLPELISSGQFVSLDTFDFNGHTNLAIGDLLFDDGTKEVALDGLSTTFQLSSELETDKTELDILENAILEYRHSIDTGKKGAFLIPEKLLVRFQLTKFEEILLDILKKGHLQEIARRPRLELIYEEHLLPVSRAKKIPSSADAHLASHSQCWQSKTLTGVIPKQILSLESEDELNIYENRVYVKILDLTEKLLIKRIAEVKRLEDIFGEALNFQDASDIYFELRQCIFSMWGEGFSDLGEADATAKNSETTLHVLQQMLKKIRTLQNTKLYQLLKHNSQLPLTLKMTNVFSHDQHYRHVARLWNSWLSTRQSNGIKPVDIFQRNREVASSYLRYCVDLCKRTLSELGFKAKDEECFYREGIGEVSVSANDYFEIVVRNQNSTLHFVPQFADVLLEKNVFANQENNRVLMSLHRKSAGFKDSLWCAPTNFYSLESLAKYLIEWFMKETYKPLVTNIKNLPKTLIEELETMNEGHWDFDNSEARIVKPFLSLAPNISKFLNTRATDVTIQNAGKNLISIAQSFDSLLNCPICSAKVNEDKWLVRDKSAFAISDSNCSHMWRVNQQANGTKILEVKPTKLINEQVLDSFKTYGRYFIEFEIS